jgi:hypothetical protein
MSVGEPYLSHNLHVCASCGIHASPTMDMQLILNRGAASLPEGRPRVSRGCSHCLLPGQQWQRRPQHGEREGEWEAETPCQLHRLGGQDHYFHSFPFFSFQTNA